MFAINHAAAALVLKKRFPEVRMLWLLLSVQLVEMLWVTLNLLGVERTTTEPVVHSVRDIHLAYMPYSHSVATTVLLCALVWLACDRGLHRRRLALAVTLGVASHLVLDIVTHAHDIAVVPGVSTLEIGSGLYPQLPRLAFALELVFGLSCCLYFRARPALVLVVIGLNLANVTLFFPGISGIETLLAGRATSIVLLIAFQIAQAEVDPLEYAHG